MRLGIATSNPIHPRGHRHTPRLIKLITPTLLFSLLLVAHAFAQSGPLLPGWQALFDGKTLSGWDNWGAGDWRALPTGIIRGEGKSSVLISPHTYTNFELRADVSMNADANSGIFLRAKPEGQRGKWRDAVHVVGYEAQISNSDPQKTGSLYNFVVLKERLVPDNAWFTMHIAAVGGRIIIRVNNKTTADFIDTRRTYKAGHIGLQQHHLGSAVMFRNVILRTLPDDERAATRILQEDIPGLPFMSQ